MLLSIIILAHNKHEITLSCLKAISASQVPKPFETLLVDNASFPPLEKILDENILKATNVKIIRNEENLNFSKANNQAVKLACGKYLLFLNNDVIIKNETITRLIESCTPVSIVGGKLIFPETGLIQHAGISHMLWGKPSNYGVEAKTEHEAFNIKRERFAVTGALQIVRKEFFLQLGGFDEIFSWGYEDVDLCLKAKQASAKIIYEPQAQATHIESATLSRVRSNNNDSRNYKHYRKKWDFKLKSAEDNYIESLLSHKNKLVGIFGTGAAATSLFNRFSETALETICFISEQKTTQTPRSISGIPVLDLNNSSKLPLDLMIIASQFHYNIYPRVSNFFHKDIILHPVVIE